MDKNNPSDIRRLARKLARDSHDALLRLANVLNVIHCDQYYYEWGYDSWQDYVENEIGTYVGASYELMRISRWIQRERPTAEQKRRIISLGRCKASVLARGIRNQDLNEWLDLARKITLPELRDKVNGKRNGHLTIGVWATKTQNKVIRRAIAVAGEQGGGEIMGERLAAVCGDYLERYDPMKKKKKAS